MGMNLAHWSHSQAVWPSGECRGREERAEAGRAVGQVLGRGLEAKFRIWDSIPEAVGEHWRVCIRGTPWSDLDFVKMLHSGSHVERAGV